MVALVVTGLQAGFFDPCAQHLGSAELGAHSSTGGRYSGTFVVAFGVVALGVAGGVTATSFFVTLTGG